MKKTRLFWPGLVVVLLLALLPIGRTLAGEPLFPQREAVEAQVRRIENTTAMPDSVWVVETVDTGGDVGMWSALALDTATRPHVSYYDASNDDLKYAAFDGAGWQISTVDSSGDAGWFTSIALDGSDRPRVSYFRHLAGLGYAQYDGTSWLTETVEPGAYVGAYTSLALDTMGYPHISYIHNTDEPYPGPDPTPLAKGGLEAGGMPLAARDLRYTWFDGLSWSYTTVDTHLGDSGGYTSIALDSSGYPHISYFDSTSSDLMYAWFDGTFWQIVSADSFGAVGMYSSLALDALDRPHISYHDMTNGALRYAYYDGSAWQRVPVDSMGNTGWHTSLALDSAGNPHISYMDYSSADLKYATFDGTTWQIVTVDGANNVGGYTSIALDSYNFPHITYYDYTNGDLKYAHLQCVPVDGAGITGPANLLTGEVGLYTASYTPITATTPVTFTWAASGGGTGTVGNTATYSWTTPGIYTITVTAANLCGQVQETFVVNVCQPVTDVSISGPTDLLVGEMGTYNAVYSPITATAPVVLTWDNGTSGPSANYSWPGPGTYTITVTATNPCGSAQGSFVVHVCQPVEGVSIDGPGDLLVGETGLYTASYAPPTATLPVGYAWDNGSSGPTAVYSWTTPGTYTITVTATNPCGSARQSFVVNVCLPVDDVTISGPTDLPTWQTGTYTASYAPPGATLPVVLTWDNGSVGSSANYSWTLPGLHTIFVTATNPCGQVQDALQVNVCQPVEGAQIYGPMGLLPGETGVYTASYSPPNASLPVTLTWAASGGGAGTVGSTAVYSWSTPGTYTITLTAANPCGQVQETFTVVVGCQPVEAVQASGPTALLVGEAGLYGAVFSPPTATLPVTLTWAASGGGAGAAGPTAVYSWTAPGTYVVTVTAANPCGLVQDTVVVHVCQPVEGALINGPMELLVDEVGTYTGSFLPITATTPVTLTWDNRTTGPSANYSWAAPGSYTITLTATNGCGSAQGAFTVHVRCQPVEAVQISGPDHLLTDEIGVFTVTYAPPTTTLPITFVWDNGTVGDTASYSWPMSGTYTIVVTATNPCGVVTGTFDVLVEPPVFSLYMPLVYNHGIPGVLQR